MPPTPLRKRLTNEDKMKITLKEQNGRKFKANKNYRCLFCKPTYP